MFIPIIIVAILSSVLGFKAGEANEKVVAVETHKVCFGEDYNNRPAGCYKVGTKPEVKSVK